MGKSNFFVRLTVFITSFVSLLIGSSCSINGKITDLNSTNSAVVSFSLSEAPRSLSSSPAITFSEVASAVGYEAQIIKASDQSVIKDWTAVSNGSSISGLSLVAGQTYTYRLRAIYSDGSRSTVSDGSSFVAMTDDFDICTDGQVQATAVSGLNLFVGGTFTALGKCTGNGVPVSATSGQFSSLAAIAKVNGPIYASVVDGAGYTYIGGYFNQVGGSTHVRIARLKPDGSVDNTWNPTVDTGIVYALALNGSDVYVGGTFISVNSTAYFYLASLDTTTGALTGHHPLISAGNAVYAFAQASATLMYVGGNFLVVNGSTRKNIFAFNPSTGAFTAAFADPNLNGNVNSLALNGGNVYAGGAFTQSGATTRNAAACFNSAGVLQAWNPNVSGTVISIVSNGTNLYMGGGFTAIGGTGRSNLGAVSTAGVLQAWNPGSSGVFNGNLGGGVRSIVNVGSNFYIGGGFTSVGGVTRWGAALVDSSGNVDSSWNPQVGGLARTLAYNSTTNQIFIGGSIGSMGSYVSRRFGLASIDLSTAAVNSWDPNQSGSATPVSNKLLVSGNSLYVAGQFSSIGGQTREGIAKFNISDGSLSSWQADVDIGMNVNDLIVDGSRVYFVGMFSTVNGQAMANAAAVDETTGSLISTWNPSPDGSVQSIAKIGNNIVLSGGFTNIGISPANSLASVDTTAGNLIQDLNANNNANAMLSDGTNLFMAAQFTTVLGGTTRNNFAIFNSSLGLNSYAPSLNSASRAVASNNGILYIAGDFTTVSTQTRNGLAALNTSTQSVQTWNPNLVLCGGVSVTGYSLATSGSNVIAGGYFCGVTGSTKFRNSILLIDKTSATVY